MLVEFISEEQVIIQQAELLRSRLLLEEELLSLIMKTEHFPRNMRAGVGSADLEHICWVNSMRISMIKAISSWLF